jgi:choline dehydrogenase
MCSIQLRPGLQRKDRNKTVQRLSEEEFDYVIVGAGTAGCTLANRLSADPRNRVLLLEAGPADIDPWIHLPAGFFRHIKSPTVNWNYETDPIPGFNNRVIPWARGKVLGGSSSINGLVYIRGQQEDFNLWRQLGNVGWAYDDVLPYFKKNEDQEHGADRFHGAGGPIAITDLRTPHVLHDSFVKACESLGYPRTRDFNGASQEGTGFYQLTVRGRRRASAAVGYLRPARSRRNLEVRTRAIATRVYVVDRTATGIDYEWQGEIRHARTRAEVILAAGAVASPHLLQLSGIGPGQLLAQHGIEVVHDLAGVGLNLQDHYAARVQYRCKPGVVTLNEVYHNPLRQVWATFQYLFGKTGPLMMGAAPVGLFARTSAQVETPDVQYQFLAGSQKRIGEPMHGFPGCTLAVIPCRPESRGTIRIRSNNPHDKPSIQPNYLATERDRRTIIEGLKIGRRVFQTSPMRELMAEELLPGPHVETDEAWLEHARNASGTSFHPTSSCMMGGRADAVVDNELRVHGLDRLRVIDASIMPTVVSGNTNAAVYMIAEKGADMVLAAAKA